MSLLAAGYDVVAAEDGFRALSQLRRKLRDFGDEVPFGVIADGFFAKRRQPKNLLRTIQRLLRAGPARSSEHYRECAPAWIPRIGNDSKAMRCVVLTCAECLRAFSINLTEGTGELLEIPCRSCHSMNRYIIQPSSHSVLEASA